MNTATALAISKAGVMMFMNMLLRAVLLGLKDLGEPNWEELLYGHIERMYRRPAEELDFLVPINNG